MNPKPLASAAMILAALLNTTCRSAPEGMGLRQVCDARDGDDVFGQECGRLASLREEMLETNEKLRGQSARELVEDFRRTVDYAGSPRTPAVVCKKSLSSVYCLRTEEIFVHYTADAARQIAEELANALRAHEGDVSDSGLIFCPTGEPEVFDLSQVSDTDVFTVRATSSNSAGLSDSISSKLAPRSEAAAAIESSTLERLASDACDPGSSDIPIGGPPIPGSRNAFNQCMVDGASSDPLAPLEAALAIAAAATACMEDVLAAPGGENNPLAQAQEDLAIVMNVAGSTAGSSSAKWDEYGSAEFKATDDDGEWTMSVSTSGEFIIYDPDGTNVDSGELAGDPGAAMADTGPFAGVVADDEGISVTFDDGSKTTLGPEGEVTKEKDDDTVEEPARVEPPEDPPLEPIPPEGGRCAPEDPSCTCGAKADLAQFGLGACMAGKSACQNIVSTLSCCENTYGMDPLARPDPDGRFVCEDAAAGAASQVQYCAEQCSVFEWDGCMEWCLSGQGSAVPGAGWLDNICLYVAGFECTRITIPEVTGLPVGGGETPGGARPDGLPTVPSRVTELPSFDGMFGQPDYELFEQLIIRP